MTNVTNSVITGPLSDAERELIFETELLPPDNLLSMRVER